MFKATGFRSPADDYQEKELNLHHHLVKNPSSTYFMKSKRARFYNSLIKENDLLVIDKSLKLKIDSIVVCIINGEFEVKKVIKTFPEVWLTENGKVTILNSNPDNEIWGTVSYIIHGV